MCAPDHVRLLKILVDAYQPPLEGGAERQPILFLKTMGGIHLQHPALPEAIPDADEATLDELRNEGLIAYEYTGPGSMLITPTPRGRATVAEYERSQSEEPAADLSPLLAALDAQANSENRFAWPAVRAALVALRDYWANAGFSPYGIQLRPLLAACPEDRLPLLTATIRALLDGDYLVAIGNLQLGDVPAEVKLTDRARAAVDGWPGADPSDLVENLLAVLAERERAESDPIQKRRWQTLLATIREIGVGVAGEVLAKAITGGR